jgi:hypothetical protein
MKRAFFSFLAIAVILSACTPSHKVTSFWVDKNAKPAEPYKSIFIVALTSNVNAKKYVENELAKQIIASGHTAIKSTDIFTPKYLGNDTLTGDKLAKAIKESGCDAVITMALLDVKSETSYRQGTPYYPTAGYYGGYGRYYGHYYYMPYSPGYYEENKTYFIETNFFDAAKDKLLISIQSEAYNPSSLESFFKSYSYALKYKLKEEGLLKK